MRLDTNISGSTCILISVTGPDRNKNSNTANIQIHNEDVSTSSATINQSKTRIGNKWLGLLLALFSGFLFASVGIVVKHLKGYHVLTLGLFRFLGVFLPALPCTLLEIWKHVDKEQGIFEPLWPLTEPAKIKTLSVLFGRALFGFGAIICQFLAIQHIPLADAVVISSCSSVFVGLVARFFLKEKCGVFPFLTAMLTVVGVTIMARPPLITGAEQVDWNTTVGTLFALSRMVLTSFKIVFVRYLRDVNASLVVMTTGLVQLVACISLALALGVFQIPTNPAHLGLLTLLGALSFMSQMSLTWALKCEKAGPFAVIRTSSDTVFAFLLQFLILSVVPDLYSGVGAAVVTLAVLLTIFKKWLSTLPEEDGWRKTFACVLK